MRDPAVRRERLAQAMREVLSELILTESKDPRLAGVVVSAVELSADLKLARAFFSVFGDSERERQAADGLQQARNYLRRQLGRRLRMHSSPEIEFRRDLGFERADRVQRLLDEIAVDRAAADEREGPEPGHDERPEAVSLPEPGSRTPDPGTGGRRG
jgi:ribosome-binding factor A